VFWPLKWTPKPGMVVYTCNNNNQEPEAGGSLIQGQPRLHSKILSQKKKKKKSK
jgi:hypothetical protein